MLKTKIAVLVSGGGTNLQALMDAQDNNTLKSGEIALVVSDNPGAYALERAKRHHIAAEVISKAEYPSQAQFEARLEEVLAQNNIDLIVLAGFVRILSPAFTAAHPKRIINVHPSLIPSFCGKGCYGIKVHEQALKYGVKVTGATVHFVNEILDGGEIILQKAVSVYKNDTPESLQARVMRMAEWKLLPLAVEMVSKNIKKGVG